MFGRRRFLVAEGSEQRLTPRQAYLCMFEFLRRHYERGPTEGVGVLLGSLSLLPDGQPADPAYAADWAEAVAAVVAAEATGGYTEAAFRLG
jgi:hypothetical protein